MCHCYTLHPACPQEVAIWQLGAGAMPSAASQLVSRRYAGAALSGSNLRANSGQAAWRSGSQAPSASAGHRSEGNSSACTNTSRERLLRVFLFQALKVGMLSRVRFAVLDIVGFMLR